MAAVSEYHNADKKKPDGPARHLHKIKWLGIQGREHASSLPGQTVLVKSNGDTYNCCVHLRIQAQPMSAASLFGTH